MAAQVVASRAVLSSTKLVSYQLPVELIQRGGETLVFAIHQLINNIWNNEELLDQWNESIIVPAHTMGDNTAGNNYRGIIIRWILLRWDVVIWTGLVWLRIETSGGLL
jgi:16S rRNA G527 N7-methylase RsmG